MITKEHFTHELGFWLSLNNDIEEMKRNCWQILRFHQTLVTQRGLLSAHFQFSSLR